MRPGEENEERSCTRRSIPGGRVQLSRRLFLIKLRSDLESSKFGTVPTDYLPSLVIYRGVSFANLVPMFARATYEIANL